jgi:hypothetical protein
MSCVVSRRERSTVGDAALWGRENVPAQCLPGQNCSEVCKQWDVLPRPMKALMCQSGRVINHRHPKGCPSDCLHSEGRWSRSNRRSNVCAKFCASDRRWPAAVGHLSAAGTLTTHSCVGGRTSAERLLRRAGSLCRALSLRIRQCLSTSSGVLFCFLVGHVTTY